MEVSTSNVLVLPFTASSVSVARRRLIDDLASAGVYGGTSCDAGLALSELISNSLRHATPLPGNTLRVYWRLRLEIVEIAVSDAGGPTVPRVTNSPGTEVGGRGLAIVERLSLRWGVLAEATIGSDTPAGKGIQSGTDASNGADVANGAKVADAHGGHEPPETTVWAELPVRYGLSDRLVTVSAGDA